MFNVISIKNLLYNVLRKKLPSRGGATHCETKNYLQKLRQKGSILVEFAIGVPLLLACAAAMHDIPKYARVKSKMEFCAHCAVNMFQNISMNRANKKVTLQDFKYISCAAFLPYFGGGEKQYDSDNSVSTLGYLGEFILIYVKGTENSKARIFWEISSFMTKAPPQREAVTAISGIPWPDHNLVQKQINVEYDSDDIYKSLKINNGEVKMILDICLWTNGSTSNDRKIFGFFLLTPKRETSMGLFHSVVIFTPKTGLFSETPPQ